MKQLLLFLFTFLTSQHFAYSAAIPAGMTVSLQPFAGYEKVVKYYPTIHYKDRLIVGARFIVGYQSIAGEGEVSRGEDTEYFYDMPLLLDPTVKIKDTTERLKLGLRKVYSLGTILSAHLRGGGQASRTKHDYTNKGVTVTTKDPIKIAPYLGAGIKASLLGKISVVADGVVIVNDVHDLRRTEYQATGGISLDL